MNMLLMEYEKKQMISELQGITDESDLIDFMRKYFQHEFAWVIDEPYIKGIYWK